jgi:Ca2+-binding RTX toxin-like protein
VGAKACIGQRGQYMAASITRFKPEKVNSYTDDWQSSPKVTGLIDGGWLVTWESEYQDGSGSGIYQQRYSADGTAVGAETKVNSTTADDQMAPSVVALSDGGWVVTWQSSGQDSDDNDIYHQRYDADGAAIGTEKKVNFVTAGEQKSPSMTALADGGWMITWQSNNQNGSGYDIYQQRYGSNGTTVGSAAKVNVHTAGAQIDPVVAGLAGGGWVVTWSSNEQDGEAWGVYQRGSNVGEKRVNSSTSGSQSDASVTPLADGGWVIVWDSELSEEDLFISSDLYQQRYAANGTAIGGETKVNSTSKDPGTATITALADGGWLVTWVVSTDDLYLSTSSIIQQRYDANGSPVGGEQKVASSEHESYASPMVTTLADGGWLVTWMSNEPGGTWDIFQQRYDANGKAFGTAATAFSPNIDTGLGTSGDDWFAAESNGLSPGDSLEGGDGIDTLQLSESGGLDLTAPDLLTGIEIIQGSSSYDFVIVDVAHLVGIASIDGGTGYDELRLKPGTYDLTDKAISGFETITLEEASSVTLADKATALLVRSLYKDGAITLQGGAFTYAERQQLYNHGIRQVTDASGTHILKPVVPSLSASKAQEGAKAGTIVGALLATDPNPGDGLSFSLADSAGGRFKIAGNQIQVANGALLDYEQGVSHEVIVKIVDQGGLESYYLFTITISDVATENVTGTSLSEVLKGGTGKDVFNGAAGNDQLYGGLNDDKLWGGLGKDTLTGGSGKDVFVFDTKPSKSTNRDSIADFVAKDDSLWLDNRIFTKLGKAGSATKPALLNKSYFALDKAKDTNDYLVYNRKTGVLTYDADGSGTKHARAKGLRHPSSFPGRSGHQCYPWALNQRSRFYSTRHSA